MKDMVFQALEAFKVHYEGKSFNLTNCWMIINGEEKFKVQYTAINVRGGKEVVEQHGEGENPWQQGKANSNKEDKCKAASLSLQATLKHMIANKDSREEKSRQDKEEQIRAFMEIQNKKLALEAEKKAKMLEIEATKEATKA
ncbi:C2 domain-containing protein [Hordeum vulgare]|nr:C2 domain-containing protein [Hordeum vulgare]